MGHDHMVEKIDYKIPREHRRLIFRVESILTSIDGMHPQNGGGTVEI